MNVFRFRSATVREGVATVRTSAKTIIITITIIIVVVEKRVQVFGVVAKRRARDRASNHLI